MIYSDFMVNELDCINLWTGNINAEKSKTNVSFVFYNNVIDTFYFENQHEVDVRKTMQFIQSTEFKKISDQLLGKGVNQDKALAILKNAGVQIVDID